jgi:hypothetical protein
VFTHWVSVPNLRKPPPLLAQRAIAGRELPFLGSIEGFRVGASFQRLQSDRQQRRD